MAWFWHTTTLLQVIGQERMTSWKSPKNEEEITSLFEMSSSATIVIVCPLFTPTSGLKTQSADAQWTIFGLFSISLQTHNADAQWTAFLAPFFYFTSEGDSNPTPLTSPLNEKVLILCIKELDNFDKSWTTLIKPIPWSDLGPIANVPHHPPPLEQLSWMRGKIVDLLTAARRCTSKISMKIN